MSTIVRSYFLSPYRITRRLISLNAQIAHMGLYRKNAACWRILDCNVRSGHSVIIQSKWTNKERQEIMAVWPDVVRDVTDAVKSLNIPDVPEWIAKVLQYNVPGGKQHRALTVIHAYKSLAPNDQLTEENIRLVQILAWCTQMIQAYIFMIDDIMDRSLLRRGQPCWYRYNGIINPSANNDAVMLENFAFYLIRKHFKGKDCYVDLVETFQDIILKILIGQSLDMLSSNFGKKPNLDLFTMNRYNSAVKYKASYTVNLSIITAMNLAGIKDPELFRQAKSISLKIGHIYQTGNDYFCCFGDAKTFGEGDTDIQEGKCTWLVVKALQRATPEQRKILEECYGFSDLEKVERVKQLFIDLDLPNAYSIYEEEIYNLLRVHIQQISDGPLHNFFLNLLSKIYHRMS